MKVYELMEILSNLDPILEVTISDYGDDSREDDDGNALCVFHEIGGAEEIKTDGGENVISIYQKDF